MIASGVVFKGSILFLKIKVDDNFYNIYNFLVSQSNVFALKSFTEFSTHCDQHKDGPVIIGGDFNCTDDPSIDRLHRPTEHRPQVAMALRYSMHCLYLCDVWRRLNPSENKFTWFRNRKSVPGGVSKARLDRFYAATSIVPSIHSCQIIPCSLSDHSAVSLCFKCPPRNKGSAYWHFNNSLLEDKNYHDIISLFWSNWQLEKSSFTNISNWWDLGKAQIKSLTQTYCREKAKEKRKTFQEINSIIEDIQSAPDLTPETQQVLKLQRNELNSFLKSKAQGALVRSRFQHINEVDTSSSYFFSLEKNHSQSKSLSCLRLPSGLLTEEPEKIKSHCRNFYKNLYSRAPTDESALGPLLQN